MEKPMYVTLDALMDVNLVKKVDEGYKSRTFAELIGKMVDGNPDQYNEEAYNAQEMRVANYAKDLLTQAQTNPEAARLYAFSNDEPPQQIHLSLNDKVSDYNNRILKLETITGDSGEETRYQKIDLALTDGTTGGLYKLEKPMHVTLDALM